MCDFFLSAGWMAKKRLGLSYWQAVCNRAPANISTVDHQNVVIDPTSSGAEELASPRDVSFA